jgi:hypothetical protein
LAKVSLDAFSLLTTLISVGDVFLCRLVREDSGDEGCGDPTSAATLRGTRREVSPPTTPTTHVDFDDQTRTVKDSARWYADVAARNALPDRPPAG